MRELAEEVLRDHGHRTILSGDGTAALRRLAAGEAVDLIVTDIALSGGAGGHELAAEAQAMRPGLRVLFITGHADEAEAASSGMLPNVEILPKPFQIRALTDKVTKLLMAAAPSVTAEAQADDA